MGMMHTSQAPCYLWLPYYERRYDFYRWSQQHMVDSIDLICGTQLEESLLPYLGAKYAETRPAKDDS